MTRQIQLGNPLIDQFPVFGLDGYTKVSGETVFTTSIWKDAIVSGLSSTIVEIDSTGDYKFECTPDAEGFWRVEVLINYNKEVWKSEFVVVSGTVDELYDMVRRSLGLNKENIFIDNTNYDANGQLISGRVRLFDSKTNCDLATDGGSETIGLIATYAIDTSWDVVNQFNFYKQTLVS